MEEWYIVTGANRGIGEALVETLLGAGVPVIGIQRTLGHPARAARSTRYLAYGLDLQDPERISEFGDWLRNRGFRIRCLVNNAGVCLDGGGSFLLEEATFQRLAADILERTFQVNLFAPVYLIQAVTPSLVAGGVVLNLSSALGAMDELDAGWLAYRTSKAALNAMTLILARELAADHIKVNAVNPGWVKTAMGGSNAPDQPGAVAAWIQGVIEDLLEGRLASGSILSFDGGRRSEP